MKKIYIIPTVNIVKVKPVCMLSDSIAKGEEFDSGNGDVVLGRRDRKTVWDDEEEDEEDFY